MATSSLTVLISSITVPGGRPVEPLGVTDGASMPLYAKAPGHVAVAHDLVEQRPPGQITVLVIEPIRIVNHRDMGVPLC
ncbi:hypothetical protein [Mycobacterium haemophilum]